MNEEILGGRLKGHEASMIINALRAIPQQLSSRSRREVCKLNYTLMTSWSQFLVLLLAFKVENSENFRFHACVVSTCPVVSGNIMLFTT